jgi:hypothetical protein
VVLQVAPSVLDVSSFANGAVNAFNPHMAITNTASAAATSDSGAV